MITTGGPWPPENQENNKHGNVPGDAVKDPVENIVASALTCAGIEYVGGHDPRTKNLDFFLVVEGIHIECKQFPTDRIVEQMRRVDDVIVIQGVKAAKVFAQMIKRSMNLDGK